MGQLKVTQIRSPIGGTARQRATLRALGLKRIRDVVVVEDRPELRGMATAVAHLVSVEEVPVEEVPAASLAADNAADKAADNAEEVAGS